MEKDGERKERKERKNLVRNPSLSFSTEELIFRRTKNPKSKESRAQNSLLGILEKRKKGESRKRMGKVQRPLIILFVSIFLVIVFAFMMSNFLSTAIGVDSETSPPSLALCPASPNCVCSQLCSPTDTTHYIDPLSYPNGTLSASPIEALKRIIKDYPRTFIEKEEDNYLHAVFISKLIRFRDDVEAFWLEEEGVVHIRSRSRVGYGDLGVNRDRVEYLREQLNLFYQNSQE